jgi:hypothetical protein
MQNQKTQSVQSSGQPKTLKSELGHIENLKNTQLAKLVINSDGEYHKLESNKRAIDVMKHINSTMKTKGYGVYVLHDALWIVPFVHPEVVVADFQRAVHVLPNNKASLAHTLKIDTTPVIESTQKQKRNIPWWAVAIAAVAIWYFV